MKTSVSGRVRDLNLVVYDTTSPRFQDQFFYGIYDFIGTLVGHFTRILLLVIVSPIIISGL